MKSLFLLIVPASLLLTAGLAALPPWIPLAERARTADVVLIGEIEKSSAESFYSHYRRGSMQVRRIKTLKGRMERPRVNLVFLMTGGISEGKINEMPGRGTYIFFLKRKQVQDSSGNRGTALVFIRPQLFAFAEHNAENEAKVKAALAR